MKLDIDFSTLLANVRKMGIKELVDFTINFDSKPIEIEIGELETSMGLEIPIEAVEIDPHSGVFTYQGKHIVLFIPDHSYNYDEVILDSKVKGNKFHLTDCATLEQMRSAGRFKRYYATRNRSGVFRIFNSIGQDAEVELSVCKNCLSKLNYNNYSQNRNFVFNTFTLESFFKDYETFFRHLPDDIGQNNGGYTNNWDEISKEYRRAINYCCEKCGVNLSQYPYLLDVHHKNGVKQDNSKYNLRALCKLCHSKEELHEHMIINDKDRQVIEELRNKQSSFFNEDIPF